ncbi:MAG: methyltransferase domain-containing protein [Tissierellia bacterium]|nr:methyltransferase domain-containing protein [Tissierellia bacterium]
MKNDIRKVLLSNFIISWIFWGILIYLTRVYGFSYMSFPGNLLFAFGFLTPMVIAIRIRFLKYRDNFKMNDKEKSFFSDYYEWILKNNKNFKYYLIVVIIILAGILLSTDGIANSSLDFFIFFLVSLFILGGSGEVLWRGVLYDLFKEKNKSFSNYIILSIIWAIWQLPLFFVDGIYSDISFPFFFFSSILLAAILMYIREKGSIFQCMLLYSIIIASYMHLNIKSKGFIIISQLIVFLYSLYKLMHMDSAESGIWDRMAGIYDKFLDKDRAAYEKVSSKILKYPREYKALELCAGTGILTNLLFKHFKDYEASDFSADMLNKLEEKIGSSNIKISKIDCKNTEKKSGDYDLVIMANAIHIIPDPEEVLVEVSRILKDSGVFIVATFLREDSLKQKFMSKLLNLAGVKTYGFWNYEEYMKFFKDNGWEIIESDKIPSGFPIGYVELKKLKFN